jgi:hypothetical protein
MVSGTSSAKRIEMKRIKASEIRVSILTIRGQGRARGRVLQGKSCSQMKLMVT